MPPVRTINTKQALARSLLGFVCGARVPTPSSGLTCPGFTALPPQSDPSRAEVPQALAVVLLQEVVTSNRLQSRYGLQSQLSFSCIILYEYQVQDQTRGKLVQHSAISPAVCIDSVVVEHLQQ